MSDVIVAKRYADALFQLANEKQETEMLIEELKVVQDVFRANPELIQLLEHPRITTDEKMTLINDAFGKCGKNVVNTLKILTERHRIGIINGMIEQVTELYNEANGIAVATVNSVRELSNKEQEKVATSLAKQLQKKEIRIFNVIDPSILGGLKIRVGNTIYDGTISGKLNQMKHNIGTPSI